MRRHLAWLAFVLIVTTGSWRAASTRLQTPIAQPDPVGQLVSRLGAALSAGRLADFRSLLSPSAVTGNGEAIDALFDPKPQVATVRQRDRAPHGDGTRLLIEILVVRDDEASVTTWQLDAHARPGSTGFEITAIKAMGAVDGLYRLTLDGTQEFRVRDFRFTAPDLTMRLATGVAFLANMGSNVTALVFNGAGHVEFRPADLTERGQLVVFGRSPELTGLIDAAYIRVNPAELLTFLSDRSLVTTGVDANDLKRARAVFDEYAPRSYSLSLGDLSAERWTIVPPPGDAVVEMQTRRFGWLTYARSARDAEDVSLFDRKNKHNIASYASAASVGERGRFYSEDDNLEYDVLHNAIDVTFMPERAWLDGRAALRIRILHDDTRSLNLRLAESLTVKTVVSPELGRLLHLRVIGQNSLIVDLPEPQNAGAIITIAMSYAGPLEPDSLDRESIAVSPDPATARLAAALPSTALGAGGADQQTSSAQSETPLSPEERWIYSNGVYWYPQSPVSDYATATITLTVPAGYGVVASGTRVPGGDGAEELRKSNERGAMHTERFEANSPIRYLACLISKFIVVGHTGVKVPALAPRVITEHVPAHGPASVFIDSIATPRETGQAKAYEPRVAEIFRFYAGLIGEAPYPSFTLATLDANLPGGHSPAYFAALDRPLPTSPYTWANDPVALDDYPFYYLSHEIAHQWWGQAVGTKNYHDQWLSEGLSQFFALLYTTSERGPDARRDLLMRMRRSADMYASAGPIYLGYRLGHIKNDRQAFRAIVYNKSALVLDMLRRFIGEKAFMDGLRRFYRDERFAKAGTDDLRRAFEAEAHRPLTRFFDRWMMNASIPQLRTSARVDDAAGVVNVRVEQIGDVFDVPVTVHIEFVDGTTEDITLSVSDALFTARLPISGSVRRVTFDKDLTLADFVG